MVVCNALRVENERLQTVIDDLQRHRAHPDELARLKDDVETLRVENRELHNELAAFDPQFFEEIEDLKFQHGVAVGSCTRVDECNRVDLGCVSEFYLTKLRQWHQHHEYILSMCLK